MKLIKFKEQTVVIAKDQPEYEPLPAHVFEGDEQGRIACCWRLSWWERLRVLITGRVWHQVLTFGEALQPQLLTVERPDMRGAWERWREALVALATVQGIAWLLSDLEEHRDAFEDGMTPEECLEEVMLTAAGHAE